MYSFTAKEKKMQIWQTEVEVAEFSKTVEPFLFYLF